MIHYEYHTDFILPDVDSFSSWIERIINSENKELGEIEYFFVDDEELLSINQKHLRHDTLTDIITFDYVVHNLIQGDIFVSVERIKENAINLKIDFNHELLRVMAHGLLHLCGYKDKTAADSLLMQQKEDEKIRLFHVKR